MQMHPSAGYRLVVPLLIVGVAFWARPFIDLLAGDSRVILDNFPYLICVVCVAMAYLFGRQRLLLAAIGVASLYWLIQGHLQVSLSDPDAGRLYLIASLCLPVLVCYLFLMPERGIFSLYGLLFSVCFIGLAGACFPLADWVLQSVDDPGAWFAPRPAQGYVLSMGASVLVAAVAVLGLLLLMWRNSESEAALLAVLGSGYAALAFLHLENISVAMASAAGLCLAWCLVRSSHSMAYRDELTGLLSRRALNERFNSLGRRYTIAMLDVDHFKRFNDTHGHDVGDEVLKFVASRVRQVGAGGTAYRYGGEEFCIVFPRKSSEDCAAALEVVRESIADYKMSIRNRQQRPVKTKDGSRKRGATRDNGKRVSVTVSAGVAARNESNSCPEDVLLAADSKLYRAKKAGRNKVIF
jgi:diguanylate cyclase (GGDEF)-like protein